MTESIFCCCLVSQLCLTLLQPHGLYASSFLCPWNLPGKTTGVGCHFLLQGIFPSQGSNPGLLRWQADSLPLTRQKNPRYSLGIIFFLVVTPYSTWDLIFHTSDRTCASCSGSVESDRQESPLIIVNFHREMIFFQIQSNSLISMKHHLHICFLMKQLKEVQRSITHFIFQLYLSHTFVKQYR